MKRYLVKRTIVLLSCILLAVLLLSSASDVVDEMENYNDYIHTIYSNLNKPSETHISGLDLSYLPDKSMLLPANSSGASIKYLVSGAEELSVQFYSSFGNLPYDGGGEYILGAETTADIIGGQVYKGEHNLLYISPDGDVFISEGNFLYGEISFPYPYSGDVSDIRKLPILGVGLLAGDEKASTRIFPAAMSVNYISDSLNSDLAGLFLHTIKFNIPSGVSEITVEINDIAGVDDALCLDEPYFTAISRIVFSGDKLAFKKNEVVEPSGETSTPEPRPPLVPPGESSLPGTGESSVLEPLPGNENSAGKELYFTSGGYFSSDNESGSKFSYDYGEKFGTAKRQGSGSAGSMGAKPSGTRVYSIITKVEASESAIAGGQEKELVSLADIESLADVPQEKSYITHLIILAVLCAISIIISFFVSFRSMKEDDTNKE